MRKENLSRVSKHVYTLGKEKLGVGEEIEAERNAETKFQRLEVTKCMQKTSSNSVTPEYKMQGRGVAKQEAKEIGR